MLQRFFTVTAKGKKGKNKQPFVELRTDAGERLTVYLESAAELAAYNIDDEFAVAIGGGTWQTKLPG
ncbi:MAG: hypothetical protein NWE99_10835 [Candidatus Bathyarchaeota archaeon]|nr:hypothetical protein [Candidatus Bathyarchaeota archaeon]